MPNRKRRGRGKSGVYQRDPVGRGGAMATGFRRVLRVDSSEK